MNEVRLEREVKVAYGRLIQSKVALCEVTEKLIAQNQLFEADKAKIEASGQFDGKNAETRKAQSLAFFADRIREISETEKIERAAKANLDLCQMRLERLKTLLRIYEL